MGIISVRFRYYTGLKRRIFRNARLFGSWDASGLYSDRWTSAPMNEIEAEDGCPCFEAAVGLNDAQVGWRFHWGVTLDGPQGDGIWGIPAELPDPASTERYRTFTLLAAGTAPQQDEYYLTHCRRLGAQKVTVPGQDAPGIRFSVWAPNAKGVEVVFGAFEPGVAETGYIADDGSGIDRRFAPPDGAVSLRPEGGGIWKADPSDSALLRDFSRFDHRPYMFRIVKDTSAVAAYRTDLHSRCQIGKGTVNPRGAPYEGPYTELDGTTGCSVVIDPETVTRRFREDKWPEIDFMPQEEFWAGEFRPDRPVPRQIEDLVIYELHVGSLGFGLGRPGNFEDAIRFIGHLRDLGVNAVELLPVLEFRGTSAWGYSTSHYCALEYSAGGRDQLKHLIREFHRSGMAVIVDVVYNHYHHDAERAEWSYDSDDPERNIYYWYEGRKGDYPEYESRASNLGDPNRPTPGHGGYVDNESTGYAPRYYEEMVRKLFIGSAAALMEEFHVDGFRVDQTTSIHAYNEIHADYDKAEKRAVPNANIFGARFLREWCRTLKLINPSVMLIAEDHSEWDKVTADPEQGGLGFDAAWYSQFYHHLIGDGKRGAADARLLHTAGFGDDRPLAMDYFAGALAHSQNRKVVYHESHDEAGNGMNTQRTIVTAVGGAALVGETRRYAESRSRFVCGMSLLSPGIPMFLIGEEVGDASPLYFDDFLRFRIDLEAERRGNGAKMFRFYQDLIRLRLANGALRTGDLAIVHVNNENRVIAFLRRGGGDQFLVAGSLNNRPFASGYVLENSVVEDGNWREVFNSDSSAYGGGNVGNPGFAIRAAGSRIAPVLPANGIVVLKRE